MAKRDLDIGAKIRASRLDTVDQYYDPEYARSVCRNVLDFLDQFYFRAKMVGFETLPHTESRETPLIYAGNHSGMAFPWDALVFASTLYRLQNYREDHPIRALVAPALSRMRVMHPFFIENFWHRMGGVDATLGNFEALSNRAHQAVIIYPEGIAGIGKGFDHRYQLQRFSNSMIRMALKYRTDIVPVLTVNGEYINPYGYRVEVINQIAQKIGIPFVPVGPLSSLISFFPWSFYFGLPAKLTYVMGSSIKLSELTDQSYEKITQKEMHRLHSVVQSHFQGELDRAVEEHGKDPYALEELTEIWWENRERLSYILPTGWPLLFHEHERLFLESKDKKSVTMNHSNPAYAAALARNPSILAYHLPGLGWPALLAQHGIK
ncbi:MAG: 1-acyl-sn-glycerol-3-phosphate acyltransferase [Leptospiraceae bacterium]|nr:1-acyl-sn-glycerol-3-phosphate acyltransferase [Leptospiraceae bacterium]